LIGVSRGRIIVSQFTQGNHQLIGPADSFSDRLLESLTQEEKEAILYKNLQKLLGL
jgi:hypothetical protein